MTSDELTDWHRWCAEDHARTLLDDILAEIGTTPADVQDVIHQLLRHHLDTDFTAGVDIIDDGVGSTRLLHRYAGREDCAPN